MEKRKYKSFKNNRDFALTDYKNPIKPKINIYREMVQKKTRRSVNQIIDLRS